MYPASLVNWEGRNMSYTVVIDALAADIERRAVKRLLERQKLMYPDCDALTIYNQCTHDAFPRKGSK